MEQRYLAELLVRRGALPAPKIEELLSAHKEKGGSLLDVAVAMRIAEEGVLARALADECGLSFVEHVDVNKLDAAATTRISYQWAKQHRVAVLQEEAQMVQVVVADPLDLSTQDDVRALFGKPLEVIVAPASNIVFAINAFQERQETASDLERESEDDSDEEVVDILDTSEDEAQIIKWVNSLFSEASKRRASDIHIEPEEREVMVRYRIDGDLIEARRAPRSRMANIVARVKIMSGLNIAEKRLPQDGRITLKIAGKGIDIRVSTIPTTRAFERIVMRILNKSSVTVELTDLGFYERDFALMDYLIHRPFGIILVTGPTGAGKTTTLYACLNRINRPDLNILTAEDPVEYELPRIHQVHVNQKIGLTFANALRAFLRQDPDVIMVGEIRDKETAEIAVHASLTGHLVLSTLHTNDAASAVARLAEMEVEPFMIATSTIGVLAQRLVRMLCPSCKEPYTATNEELLQLGMDDASIELKLKRKMRSAYLPRDVEYVAPVPQRGVRPTFYKPKGCEACDNTGYKGRRGIYELMMIEEGVRGLILKHGDANSIRKVAIENGMDTMREDGARKVLLGLTSVQEVIAITQDNMD